ncbi:lipoprotein [Massilia aurea]|uniref:Lipoprotein n=1 Tax=Massilia aurea TaxID=373040 RepID=A0A422QLI2_9BURK|nr:acyltransferase family protein [Massilia aurea]RNF30691.1 lipoprotein [Massilia aurea]
MKLEQPAIFEDRTERPHPAPVHLAYRPDIDGLRAVAVLAVVLFHAFPTWLRGGFIGVDVFFVISGFLISSILLRELRQDAFSFAGFYARRVRRIFPALVVVLAACLAFGWLALFPDEYAQLGKHVVGGAGFAANFFYWAQIGYFDTAAETKPLLHLWSLGIEEQFYILWPVVLLLAWKRRMNLLLVAAALGVVSFLVNVVGVIHHPSATFYSPASRAWEMLLGAGLACVHARAAAGLPLLPARGAARRLPRLSPDQLAWTGVVLLGAGLASITRDHRFPGWPALLPAVGALLIIAAGPRAWFNRMVLSNRLMVWVGLISYPLYLWHWPLLAFAQIIESGTPAPTIRAGVVALAFMLAWLTWRVVELPLRAAREKTVIAVLCGLMLACAATGGYLWFRQGLPEREVVQDNLANQQALVVFEDKAKAAACKARYGFESMYDYCIMSDPARDPTVVLLGDSHAYHLVYGLMKYYDGLGDNLLKLGTRYPYWGIEPGDDPYQQATQPLLEKALAMDSVKTVLISTHARFSAAPGGKVVIEAARETFRRFLGAGKHVIFISDVPTIGFDPRACIKRAGVASSATRFPCSITREEWDTQIAQHKEVLAGLAQEFPQVEWFDASEALCDERECHAMIDGRLMYRDNNHLSLDGDYLVSRHFARRPPFSPAP